jgi:aldose 1-epimerase
VCPCRYFNLNRDHTDGIRDHTLVLECAEYARCDASGTGVPTGELAPVGGTVHDFQEPKVLGPAIDAIARESPLWPHGEGFIIAENRGRDANQLGGGGMADLATVAILGCPASRLVLTVLSSEPQVQTYYATLLDPTVGKHGTVYNKHGAICLETHRCANAVNRPAFPSQIIRPGDPYRQHTVWRFTAQ